MKNFGKKRNYKILPTKEVGKNVKENFEYASDINKSWLKKSDLVSILKKLEDKK